MLNLLVDCLLRITRLRGPVLALAAGAALAALSAPAWSASTLVAAGRAIYVASPGAAPMSLKQAANPANAIVGNACNGCHFLNDPPDTDGQGSNHPLGANNPAFIQAAFATGGVMLAQIGAAAVNSPTNAQLDAFVKLSLWIGQFKAAVFRTAAAGSCTDPNLTIHATAGVAVTKDVFPCLESNGSSGVGQDSGGFTNNSATAGLTVTTVQNGVSPVGGVSTLSYDLTVQSTAAFTPGSGSFQISVVNPTATTNKTINWTVYGVTSGATALGITGTTYTAGAPLYTVSSNDVNGTFAIAGSSPTSLASLGAGMAIDGATGRITGTLTAAPGTYTVRVQVTTSAATVGAGNTGTVTKDVLLTVQGITSSDTATFSQNTPISNLYQITSFPPATSNNYSVNSADPNLVLGVDQNTGQITGTPTVPGSYTITVGATTTSGGAVTKTVNVTVAPVPVVSVTMPTPAGTRNSAITPIQVNATQGPILAYGATGLPAGLSVNGSGQIVGTPTVSGIFSVVLSAQNAAGTGFSSAVDLQINPDVAPVINSAATLNGQAGTPIVNYQITGTNGPLTAYAVKPGSTLPAGLSLSPGGVISGTPTVSGNSSAILTASNIIGTSPDFTLNFVIVPSTAPAISSPTFATLPAGTAITPIQIVATNLPIISYSATNLPPGLTLDTNTGLITGTPNTPGSYNATLNAENVVSFGAGRVVPFTITVPGPLACAITVPLNTPTTASVAGCFFAGFNPTGVTVVSTPAHGSVSVSSTNVTYTPKTNYFGSDSFTIVGTGVGGTSPVGTVSVTITGRPDPTQDKAVTATIAAQVDAAQRFSRAQIANFTRRLESLHLPPGATGVAGGTRDGSTEAVSAAGTAVAGAGLIAPAAPAVALQTGFAPRVATADRLAGRAPVNEGAALAMPQTIGQQIVHGGNLSGPGLTVGGARQLREAEALSLLANGAGIQSLPMAESVISLIKARSLNLASVGQAAGLNSRPDASGRTSYWIEGVASFGTRDATGGSASSEFSSDGITIGMDRRVSDDFAWGLGLGYARDKTAIGTDGTLTRAKGYSLAVYGSYQLRPNTYLDGLLGIGSLDFSTRRFVEPIGAFAYGNRNGTQLFGSVTGSYEIRQGNSVLAPYGRLDFASERLDTSTETGAGAFALTYFSQTSTSIQGALGLRAESAHAASFGYVIPRLRAELRHEFKGSGQAFVGYADQPGGPRFGISAAGSSRDTAVLGLGGDFLLRDGLTVSLEYQLSHSFANASSYALRLRLNKDFDVRGMPKLRLAEPEGDDDDLKWQFDGGYTRDDNVTRAKSGPDRLFDDLYAFNLSHSDWRRLGDTSRIVYGFTFGGQKFHRFNGLSNLQAGGEIEYQYRESSEFLEPTYGAFARFTAEQFESRLRDGYRLSAGLSLRLPLTDRIGAFAAVSHNLRNARSQVFSTRDNSVRGNLDYALSDRETIYLGSELRVGDIVSTGRASLENVTIAKVFAQDDAFAGGNLFSYRVDGRTWLTTIGYNLSFGSRDSIDLSWRNVRATPSLRPAFVTGPRSYRANQLSAVYLLRF